MLEVIFMVGMFGAGLFIGRRWAFVELDKPHVECKYCENYHYKCCTQIIAEEQPY